MTTIENIIQEFREKFVTAGETITTHYDKSKIVADIESFLRQKFGEVWNGVINKSLEVVNNLPEYPYEGFQRCKEDVKYGIKSLKVNDTVK